MRYFNNMNSEYMDLFYRLPQSFKPRESKELMAYGLGATLYMPATRELILKDLLSNKLKSLKSVVICLEDAVSDLEVRKAEENLINQLKQLILAKDEGRIDEEDMPLIFIRIRELQQMNMIMEAIGQNPLLTGFVFPKFSYEKGYQYLEELKEINYRYSQELYAMPILEDKNIIYKEKRLESLLKLKELFDQYKSLILNVRVGATDFSGLFGLRRNIETTIYDVAVIRNCIEDIINIFSRAEDQYVVSGSVWEYYNTAGNQRDLSDKALQGLIKEVMLDKQNSLIGKTIIHPSQILPVQALQVVTHEEYLDASRILDSSKDYNGVVKSLYENKMNEIKPHLNWAKKIILLAEIYGVFKENRSYVDLLK